jgi:hypothetical protein
MSAGWVVLIIFGMFFLTVIVIAGMLMHLYKHNEHHDVQITSTMKEGYEAPSLSLNPHSSHDRDAGSDLGTR